MSGDRASKTEKATPKKVSDARKKGQVAKSAEISAWSSTLAMTLLLPWTYTRGHDLVLSLVSALPDLIADPQPAQALRLWAHGVSGAVLVVAPLALGLMVVGVLATLAQVGFTLSPQALQPKLSKLNPLPGFKRLFGAKSLWSATKELIKLGLLGGLAYRSASGFIPHLLAGGGMTLTTVVGAVVSTVFGFLRAAALLGIVLALSDYVMERRHLAADLRMSLQEIKDETKNADGDPHVKGAIRERQMRMSRNRMLADIATADVVLVNPTHVAVALTYDPDSGAPRVVAKGSGAIATKIRERAHEHRVPLVKDVPLARALHQACEIGEEIPPELYAAVARVLAFLFSLKSRGVAAGTHVVPQPALAA